MADTGMQRSLSTLPIPATLRYKLFTNGYDAADDLKNQTPLDLSKELSISLGEAVSLLNQVFPPNEPESVVVTLHDLSKEENQYSPIITFSQKLDTALEGGIPLSKLTELSGAPGIGKTQLCLQLCVDVQIPKVCGGVGGEALYIDTEGGFTIDRLLQIAGAAIKHCQYNAEKSNKSEVMLAAKNFTTDSILGKIHYQRCHNSCELIATINLLSDFISLHPSIRLITIDSIAFPFRVQFDQKINIRTRILTEISQNLIQIATRNKLAVVVTNHMTTKFKNDGKAFLVPALGETWSQACTIRMILFWQGSQRFVDLIKSPCKPETTIPFQITISGIRDVTNHQAQMKRPVMNDEISNSNKKIKRC